MRAPVKTNVKTRVLVVDDHEPFRRFVCSMLQEQGSVQLVGEAQDGVEAVRQAELLQPDMVLLDIGLPGLNGIEAARQISKVALCRKNHLPDSRVLLEPLLTVPRIGRALVQLQKSAKSL